MRGRVTLIDRIAGRGAAALMVDGQLQDIFFDPADPETAPEAVHRAVVERPLKGQGGAIVTLGNGARGFLRHGAGLKPGTRLLVQVATRPEPGKALPVTDRLLFRGRLAILSPGAPGVNVARGLKPAEERERLAALGAEAMAGAPDDWGLILRSAAAGTPAPELRAAVAELRETAAAVLAAIGADPACLRPAPMAAERARRDWATAAALQVEARAGAFADAGIPETLAALLGTAVALPQGASFTVEPTRALVAVDVNTGPDTSPAAGLKASLAALADLPRQLRLRGLGGQIVIDPAPTPRRDRRTLEQALARALRADPVETAFAGWTPLGHMELTRKREREPLAEVLGG